MARIDIAEIHNFVSVFIAESKRVQQELEQRKTAIGSFLSDSDIQGEIGDQAKAYYRDVYYPLIKATKNSLQDAEERLKKYVSDFYSQVDSSMNAKLDLARMYELQADMRKYENKIEALKADTNSAANSMASIGKNIGLQLGMETAMGQFRKEEEILEKYEQFEATHRNMLRDVLTDLHQVKQSLAQIESGVAFNASSHMFQPTKIKLGALAPKKAKKTFNFDKYEKTLQGNYWVLTKNGKTDADCAEATIAYNDCLREGSIKGAENKQEDVAAEIIKSALKGIYYYTDAPITKAQSFSLIAGVAAGMVAIRGRGKAFPRSTINKVESDLKIKEYGKPIVIEKSINTGLIRSYVRDVEQQTGRKLANNQVDMLKNALREKEYTKLSPSDTKVHRRSFNKVKNSLITEWELKTGQVWPTYSDDVISAKNGAAIRNKGDLYDAHHLIENNFGGEHEWWNIHPAKFPNEHQAGIHGAGSPGNELFKGEK
ncbi:hypothetical protein BMT55_02695 [Listeria newyorkensis]|uniref:LXG domain-containing protein n=1 Tax=Listeria newyorkensis TaxID=1497681 RepID=A0ABX4XRM2_9LIST|nr:T7SS effector LXG polymorphic toxin [Listeria newyorkensis]KGL38301.1 hypothetical protein EP58_16220 [Listeria newyorkensis]PNP94413.1 hypothetical protein BMT55_02695 [Listeria newyorkensis]WCD42573.1 T7SS effector LXG polymorphic toxin [Listeria newyorkensis]SQC58685.1 Bacillus transposase protein [Listeria newyorkensis]